MHIMQSDRNAIFSYQNLSNSTLIKNLKSLKLDIYVGVVNVTLLFIYISAVIEKINKELTLMMFRMFFFIFMTAHLYLLILFTRPTLV